MRPNLGFKLWTITGDYQIRSDTSGGPYPGQFDGDCVVQGLEFQQGRAQAEHRSACLRQGGAGSRTGSLEARSLVPALEPLHVHQDRAERTRDSVMDIERDTFPLSAHSETASPLFRFQMQT
jgi:hypothetical protein